MYTSGGSFYLSSQSHFQAQTLGHFQKSGELYVHVAVFYAAYKLLLHPNALGQLTLREVLAGAFVFKAVAKHGSLRATVRQNLRRQTHTV